MKCGEPVDVGSANCDNCGEIYFDDFWTDFFDDWDPEMELDEFDEEAPLDPGKISIVHNLCCNLPENLCECLIKVRWDDILGLDELYIDQYEMDSPCWQCVHVTTPQCIPLRVWAREAVMHKRNIGCITPCAHHEAWEYSHIGPVHKVN